MSEIAVYYVCLEWWEYNNVLSTRFAVQTKRNSWVLSWQGRPLVRNVCRKSRKSFDVTLYHR